MVVAVVAVGSLASSLSTVLSGGAAGAAPSNEPTPVEASPPVESKPIQTEPVGPDPESDRAIRQRSRGVYPTASRATVELSREPARAGQSPIIVRSASADKDASPSTVTVEVLDQKQSAFTGPGGFGFKLDRADDSKAASSVGLEIDYSDFRQAFGGDYASRLVLMKYPTCVLERPEDPKCAVGTPIETVNDHEQGVLRTVEPVPTGVASETSTQTEGAPVPETTVPQTVPETTTTTTSVPEPTEGSGTTTTTEQVSETVPATAGVTFASSMKPSAGAGVAAAAGGSGVYGIGSGVAGTQGTFAATSLTQASRWTAGGSSGGFNWSYPIGVPEATVGPTPNLELAYSSQAVDGLTAAENGQSGFVGAGWDLTGLGFIERRYRTCSLDGTGWLTADLCWHSNNATINLNGVSGELVPTDSSGTTWKVEDDPGWRIERKFTGLNDDNNTEYWVVTTPDGMQYWFGYGEEYNSAAHTPTNAAWTVPVYGNNSGEPCYDSSASAAWCQQAYRWNLDRVVDTHGTYMTIFWTAETNRYGRAGYPNQSTSYVRGGRPERIEYSQRSGNHAPAQQVAITASGRCLEAQFYVACPAATSANASSWPDVPIDLMCSSTTYCTKYAPSFFTTERLESVYTFTNEEDGTAHTVDRYAVQTRFPDPGDTTDPRLWLNEVQQTGDPGFTFPVIAGAPVSTPPVRFNGTMMANRADSGGSVPVTNVPRITSIIGALGAKTIVVYGQPDHPCTNKSVTPTWNWSMNTQYCFPVYFKPDGLAAGWSVNNKYVVTSVTEDDVSGGSPSKVVTYDYQDAPAWHHSDDPVTPSSYQTWSEYRGHSKVAEADGVARTTYLFYRGMYGDEQVGTGPRTTTLTTQTGTTSNDWEELAGRVREKRQTTMSGGGKTGEITTYTSPQTGSGNGMTAERVLVSHVENRLGWSGGTIYTDTDTTYDSYWFPDTVMAYGESGSTDDRCTTYTYARNVSAWILDRVARETLDYNCASPYNKITDSYYDGSSTLGSLGSTGERTWQRRHIKSGGYADTRWEYDAYGRVISEQDPNLNSTTTAYDPSNHALTEKVTTNAPLGYTTRVTLDPRRALPVSSADVRNRSTTQTYDSLGRLTSVTRPGDPAGNPSYRFVYWVDPDQEHPASIETKRLTGTSPSYSYVSSFNLLDSFGRTREVQTAGTGPSGGRLVTGTKYNAQGQVARESQAYGTSGTPGGSSHTASNVLVNADGPPADTHHIYDELGRETLTKSVSYATVLWDATTSYDGFSITALTPEGRRLRSTTDSLGGLVKVEERTQLDNLYTTTRYTTSFDSQILTITDDPDGVAGTNVGSAVTSYTYDMLGRRTSVSDPDAGTWLTDYDAVGNIIHTTDAKSQHLYTKYDALNRPTERHLDSASGPMVGEWTYYDSGTNKGLQDSVITHASSGDWVNKNAAYDLAGRPTSSSFTVPLGAGPGLAGTYVSTIDQYDAAGRAVKSTMPAAGDLPTEQLTSTFNAQGMPTTLTSTIGASTTTLVESTALNDNGLLASQVLGSGVNRVQRAYTYESVGRLSSAKTTVIGASSTITAADDRYKYDDDNLLTEVNDATTGQRECYAYDYVARLVDAWTSGTCAAAPPSTTDTVGPVPYLQHFTYNRIGNLTSKSLNGSTTTNAYGERGFGPHALTTTTTGSASTTLDYDANGALVQRAGGGTTNYAWDKSQQMTSATKGAEGTVSTYAVDGNRLLREVTNSSGATTATLYLGDQELTLSPGGAVTTRRYISLGGGDLAMRTSAGLSWLLGDSNGNSSIAIPAGGSTIDRQRYLPFGSERVAPDPIQGDRGYLGKVKDSSTGLIKTDARFYDPDLGRFLSADPLVSPRDPQSLNSYSYSLNNPTTWSDPSGRDSDMQALANLIAFLEALAKAAANLHDDIICAYATNHSQYCGKPDRLSQIVDQVGKAYATYPQRQVVRLKGMYEFMRAGSCNMSANILSGACNGDDDPRAKVVESYKGKSFADIALGIVGIDTEECRQDGNWHCGTTTVMDFFVFAMVKTATGARAPASTGSRAESAAASAADDVAEAVEVHEIPVSRSRYPESASHIEDAQAAGHPAELTIDRAGAAARRRLSLKGFLTRLGFDRDEYPPAMFAEGGEGASVRYIDPSDNRGAGASIGAKCRALPDGARVRITIGC